jgi:hypothetical protein
MFFHAPRPMKAGASQAGLLVREPARVDRKSDEDQNGTDSRRGFVPPVEYQVLEQCFVVATDVHPR